MPNNIIKSFADKTGKSEDEVEKLWSKAKQISMEDKGSEDYPFIVGTLKNMLGIEENRIMTAQTIQEFLNSPLKAKQFIESKLLKETDLTLNNIASQSKDLVDFISKVKTISDKEYLTNFYNDYLEIKKQGLDMEEDYKYLKEDELEIGKKVTLKGHEYTIKKIDPKGALTLQSTFSSEVVYPVYANEIKLKENEVEEDAQVSGSLGNIATSDVGIKSSSPKEIDEATQFLKGDHVEARTSDSDFVKGVITSMDSNEVTIKTITGKELTVNTSMVQLDENFKESKLSPAEKVVAKQWQDKKWDMSTLADKYGVSVEDIKKELDIKEAIDGNIQSVSDVPYNNANGDRVETDNAEQKELPDVDGAGVVNKIQDDENSSIPQKSDDLDKPIIESYKVGQKVLITYQGNTGEAEGVIININGIADIYDIKITTDNDPYDPKGATISLHPEEFKPL
jgi:hypothetical protein